MDRPPRWVLKFLCKIFLFVITLNGQFCGRDQRWLCDWIFSGSQIPGIDFVIFTIFSFSGFHWICWDLNLRIFAKIPLENYRDRFFFRGMRFLTKNPPFVTINFLVGFSTNISFFLFKFLLPELKTISYNYSRLLGLFKGTTGLRR